MGVRPSPFVKDAWGCMWMCVGVLCVYVSMEVDVPQFLVCP